LKNDVMRGKNGSITINEIPYSDAYLLKEFSDVAQVHSTTTTTTTSTSTTKGRRAQRNALLEGLGEDIEEGEREMLEEITSAEVNLGGGRERVGERKHDRSRSRNRNRRRICAKVSFLSARTNWIFCLSRNQPKWMLFFSSRWKKKLSEKKGSPFPEMHHLLRAEDSTTSSAHPSVPFAFSCKRPLSRPSILPHRPTLLQRTRAHVPSHSIATSLTLLLLLLKT